MYEWMLDVKNMRAGCSIAEKGHRYCESDTNAMLRGNKVDVNNF